MKVITKYYIFMKEERDNGFGESILMRPVLCQKAALN